MSQFRFGRSGTRFAGTGRLCWRFDLRETFPISSAWHLRRSNWRTVPSSLFFRTSWSLDTGGFDRDHASGNCSYARSQRRRPKYSRCPDGPAEIYRVLASFPEIQESMVVKQATPGAVSDSRMVLLIVISSGHSLDPRLRARIRTALAQHASPAHIPGVIVDVSEIPVTHNGKRSELAATEALKGNDAANLSALRNPMSLKAIAARVAAYDARTATASSVISVPAATLEEELTRIWERVLGVSPIGPHDNFFQIGGTSLLTAPLFQQVAVRFGAGSRSRPSCMPQPSPHLLLFFVTIVEKAGVR